MLWAWLMSFGIPFPFLALQAERRYRSLPALSNPPAGTEKLPSLSVIVPARNEENNLRELLPTLVSQGYSGEFEIIVVDDHSTDRTVGVAEEFNVSVLEAPDLPVGWHGKPHACHTGAVRARGDWLLFVDADTRFNPGSLSTAVRFAAAQGFDGLSLLLPQESGGILERLAVMAAFAGLFAGMQGGQPVLNGQFILLRRDRYFSSGGFQSVRSEALEDLALGHLLHGHHFHVPLLLGTGAGRVRMYTDPHHLWTGLVRLGSGALRWSGRGGWVTALFITGALLPVVGVLLVLFAGMPVVWLVIAWLLVTLGFIPWAQRAGRLEFAPLAPFGAIFVQLAAVTGLLRGLAGVGVSWKGRRV